MSTFRLPRDGSIYADSIFTRCRELIGYQLWSGIQRPRLDAWIANFQSAEERYFAARVLDALIYRSDDQTIALLRQLICRIVPDCSRIYGLSDSLQNIYSTLLHPTIDPLVRVVPVLPPSSPPTKSGAIIARHLKRSLRINERWIIHPHQVPALVTSVNAFIFVDDFLGTGDQFSRFLAETGLGYYVTHSCFVYGCLAGHEEGIRLLNSVLPNVHVAAVERLDDTHAFFHAKGGSFPDDVNSIETARDFYYELLDNRRFNIASQSRRGFGHLEVAYAFEHSVPDNSLPILWWDHSSKWRSLFDR